MASKRATCFILNVSNSMKEHSSDAFEKARDAVIHLIENIVFTNRKTDLVSVLLAGTPETDNQLAKTEGGYENITEVCNPSQPLLPLLRRLKSITLTDNTFINVDVLDALILAAHMIVQKCKKLKYIKHIMIVTNSSQIIDWRDFDEVKLMLIENNISLTVVGIDLNENTRNNQNYSQWFRLISHLPDSFLLTLDEAMEETYAFHNKNIRSTPVYNGFMYLGNTPCDSTDFCAISCKMYLRTSTNQKPITPSLYSSLNPGPTNAVKRERKYVLSRESDPSTSELNEQEEIEVYKEDLEKGFRFGKSIVKISTDEMEYAKFNTQKELTILSFVPMDSIPLEYYLNRSHVVTAGDVQKEESGRAISAFSHALFTKQVGAIARWVQKIGNAPKVGVLLPYFEPDITLLHFIQLPFESDMRFYQFESEPKCNKNNPSDGEASRLMDGFIDNMDIETIPTPDPKYSTETIFLEHLIPEETFNPTIFMIENAIKKRGLEGSTPLPDLDPRLKANIEPLPKHQEISKEYGKKLQDIFKVKEVTKKETMEHKENTTQQQQENLPDVEDILREELNL